MTPARPAVRLDTGLELLLEHARARAAGPLRGRVLATIVATAGSTYRKAGARLLVEPDGTLYGLLSGGCFEHDLREHAARLGAEGPARIVEYDMRGDDDLLFGLGAGCEGAMRIVLEPAGPGTPAAAALAHAEAASAAGSATALAVVHEGPASALGTRAWPGAAGADPALLEACAAAVDLRASRGLRWNDESTPCEAWIEYLAPPPRLLVCGAGPDAVPVVAHARALGWQVTVVDHRPALARGERFPGARVRVLDAAGFGALERCGYTAAVVMSHHLASDAAYLRALATDGPGYVGLLGPRARRERLLAELGAEAAGSLGGRLRGPVGLDLGAVTPEAIALAIVAEVHAYAAGRGGGPFGASAAAATIASAP